jgi:hypothetical protein
MPSGLLTLEKELLGMKGALSAVDCGRQKSTVPAGRPVFPDAYYAVADSRG